MKMTKLLIATVSMILVVSFGCSAGDLQQMRMKDKIEMQKSEWRLPGYNLIANVTTEHRNVDGELIEAKEYRNIVVNTGKACTASRINGDGTEALFNYVAIGTGVTAEGLHRLRL